MEGDGAKLNSAQGQSLQAVPDTCIFRVFFFCIFFNEHKHVTLRRDSEVITALPFLAHCLQNIGSYTAMVLNGAAVAQVTENFQLGLN